MRAPDSLFPPASDRVRRVLPATLLTALALVSAASAQPRIQGAVVTAEGNAVADADVLVLETGETVHTDEEGRFELDAEESLTALTLQVTKGFLTGLGSVAFTGGEGDELLEVEPISLEPRHRSHERVTVSASASEAMPFEAFGQVSSFEGLALQNESARNLGELLEDAPGIAVRSFGPAPARPIVRGFDGDRVLVMEDGVRTGDLASQSADHGVPVDPLQAERVEVVRGPATLLYGSNALGGAVNVISMGSHLGHAPRRGFRGQANLDISTADGGRRGGLRVQSVGDGWFAWGGGNANRTDDYASPLGTVVNSGSSMNQGEAGIGLFGNQTWVAATVRQDNSRYGVPFAGDFHAPGGHAGHDHGHDHGHGDEEPGSLLVDVTMDRRQLRLDFGMTDLGSLFPEAEFVVRYSGYDQDELEEIVATGDEWVATHFDNDSMILRGELKRPSGRFTSRIGAWSNIRQYAAAGEEALAPETRQNAVAAFTYNEWAATDRFSLMAGARGEQNRYRVEERGAAEIRGGAFEVMDRDFLGLSGSAGARFELGAGHALVANVTRSTRAPAIEELYNYGPHAGNRAYEIGNASLNAEQSLGVDLSYRLRARRLSGSLNLFRYAIDDFIFGAATGEVEGPLPVLQWRQAEALYQGFEFEASADLGFAELVADASWVDAKLTDTNEYVPRIPPLNGQVRLDAHLGRIHVAPRMRWAAQMDRLYPGETVTDGYTLFDVTASWVWVRRDSTHNISIRGYNLTDVTYYHHTSLIKDLAAQMGRGFRLSYSIRFF